ncbi:MAG: pilin [Minisyncoccia bacterium]|jgi:hypothetical protein
MNFLINIAHAAVALPDFSTSQNIGDFMGSIYSFSITIVGILIFVRFLWGGFLYLTAAANPGNIHKAQDIMKNAVIGAIILFSAYLILYVINPDLVSNSFDFSGLVNQSSNSVSNPSAGTGSKPASSSNSGGSGVTSPSGLCYDENDIAIEDQSAADCSLQINKQNCPICH